jgi:CRP/FNR family transcriptional regulator, cyclic AMP receptor protein
LVQDSPLEQIPFEHVRSILTRLSIFGGLDERQQRFLTTFLRSQRLVAGDFVYRQGEDASHIYLIRFGEVRIMEESTEGEDVCLAVFTEGDCFGETSVVGIQPHSASAISVVDTELMILSRRSLLEIYEIAPKLFGMLILNIARETCRRLHHADLVLRQMGAANSSNSYHSPLG